MSDEDKTVDSMSLNSPFHLIQQSFLLNEILSLSHFITSLVRSLRYWVLIHAQKMITLMGATRRAIRLGKQLYSGKHIHILHYT